jgi:hypothetical protein
MRIVGEFPFNNGKEVIEARYRSELDEVRKVITAIDIDSLEKITSQEARRNYEELYSPSNMNKAFKAEFNRYGWVHRSVVCEYPTEFYTPDYRPRTKLKRAYRDMDFVKNRVGVEVQFGKYAFMVYNVCAKMTIFHNLDVIDVGIEIVPMKELTAHMSSGISTFEQFVWDLQARGVSNIDIPVLVFGVIPDQPLRYSDDELVA